MKLTPTHERWLIILIALHSLIIGIFLMFAPAWTMGFGGWKQEINVVFFIRQAGIFHVVLVAAYLIEHFKYRGVLVMVSAKSIALVFLLAASALDQVPWAVPVSGVGDGAMALVVWWVHRKVWGQAES
jgi:hypothetical protein